MSQYSTFDIMTGTDWMTKESWFYSWQGQKVFLFSSFWFHPVAYLVGTEGSSSGSKVTAA